MTQDDAGIRLSVYVPVRDAAPWLPRLLASLAKLPHEGTEIAFADDASTDASPALVHAFAASRPRVRLLQRERPGGSGACANSALDLCRGHFVHRCDADDEALPDGLLAALALAEREGLDVVLMPLVRVEADGRESLRNPDPVAEGETPLARYWRKPQPSCIATLLRRSVAVSHGVRYPEDLPKGSDGLFMRQVMAHVARERVGVSDVLAYRYFVRDGSLSHAEPAEKARRLGRELEHTIALGNALVRRGLLEPAFMREALARGPAASYVRQLRRAGLGDTALAEYHRLRALLGPSPRLRRELVRALLLPGAGGSRPRGRFPRSD